MTITDPCVVRLLAEGAAVEAFGRKDADGKWSFVGRGTSLEISDDGDETVTVGGVRRCSDLLEVLPPPWIKFIPMKVHPELREWFRQHYQSALGSLTEYERGRHLEYRHYKWQALFESTPPDRWSEEDEL